MDFDLDLVVSNESDGPAPRVSQGLSVESCEKRNTMARRELFLACIGNREFFSSQMWRVFTELVATSCLIFTLTTTIIACLDSQEAEPKFIVIAFLFLILTVPLSGGHMSPVFNFIEASKGIVTPARASLECLGSILSFLKIDCVMSQNAAEKFSFGCCITVGHETMLTTDISAQSALILDFTCTFVVLFVGATIAFDQKKRCKELGLAMVCAMMAGALRHYVFVSITVTWPAGYFGVGLNSVRCLGPAVLRRGPLWEGHLVFWVGSLVACVVYHGFAKLYLKKV